MICTTHCSLQYWEPVPGMRAAVFKAIANLDWGDVFRQVKMPQNSVAYLAVLFFTKHSSGFVSFWFQNSEEVGSGGFWQFVALVER